MTDPGGETESKRRRVPIELVVFLLIGAVAVGVWRFVVYEPRRPNVILISIDSLRPDHLGCYGYGKPTSPALDALAARGTRFETVHSSSSWTLPAHLSMMTGLPDDVHDVVYDLIKLDPRRQTLAQCFHDGGYRTAGFFGGPYLHRTWGFDRGFDIYENCGTRSLADYDPRDVQKMSREQQMMLAAKTDQESHESRTADKLETSAEQFLSSVGDRPFFLFVHHWDVHYDYIAPPEYQRMFVTPEMQPIDTRNFAYRDDINKDLPAAKVDYIKALYDAEIRWVDDHIAKLMKQLDDLGLADDTYVVVTADHGEEFFEHGEKGHRNNLFETSIRIPLIVIGPGVKRGQTVTSGVRIIDIMPTLVGLAGLPAPREAMGVSLQPFLDGDASGKITELPFSAELTHVPTKPDGSCDEKFRKVQAFGKGCFKIISEEWRLYNPNQPTKFNGLSLGAPTGEVFDLCRDPGELDGIGARQPDALAKLTKFRGEQIDGLRRMRAALANSGGDNRATIPPEILKSLRENGYVQGNPNAASEPPLTSPATTPASSPASRPKPPEDPQKSDR